ncbi:unnamed protein product [Adineta steineri]|uniref:Uncharacterized protein n=1 Tax=Adineta steineri TaxID=433720 RepID=A0A815MD18_9BILA|nr:unnamed protein product [Adineta steineri]
MPEKIRSRPSSANREQRQIQRRSSLNTDPIIFTSNSVTSTNGKIYSGIDLRTPKEKLEDLEKEILESTDKSTPEQYLNQVVLAQIYTNLEYGDISVENARAYLNLSEFYFNRNKIFLPQAKFHALNARQILEQLKIKPSNDNLIENLLAYDIYLMLIKCSLNAKREMKTTKNKHILSIDKTHINHDIKLLELYLEKLKESTNKNDYDQMNMKYLFLKYDTIVNNTKEFVKSIEIIIEQIIDYIEKYFTHDQIKRKIDLYLRCGLYFINYEDKIQDGLRYYKKAIELAEQVEKTQPSNAHKYQLAKTILERNIAKLRVDHLTDDMEKEFQRAIQLYTQPTNEITKNVLKVIDELAIFYTKMGKYQDALNILCESLPNKIRLFGEFSEEVIQTESHIGAIYLREGECLNAAEHLQACLDLQEFVYGTNDSRTSQTRNSVELLKKDPMVSRTFFARTHDGKRQDRPAFRTTNKVSHDKQDLQLFQTVTKKPPTSSKI